VELLYVREYYLKANLSAARQAYGRQILAQAGPGSNTDLQPQGLFYGLLLTGMEENALLSRGLLWLKAAGVEKLYAALALLALALWAWSIKTRARGSQTPYFYSVFTMGLTVMGLEMVVLILFQLTLGFLYGQLGLLLAAFMAGMAGGSYLAGDRLARGAPAQAMALWSQGGLGLLMLILGAGLPWLLRQPYLREEGWGQLIFTAILVSTGLLSGAVFAAQGELCRQHGATLSQSAGRLYAVDLLGATLGTLGMSFLVIPCFGPAQALFLGAAWNASAVLLLLAVKPPPAGMMT
jgi:spermidine synthase